MGYIMQQTRAKDRIEKGSPQNKNKTVELEKCSQPLETTKVNH